MKAKYRGIEFEINSREDFDLMCSLGEPAVTEEAPVQSSTPARNKHKAWSKSDDKFLMSRWDTLGIRVIAKTLGRNMSAVKTRMYDLKRKAKTAVSAATRKPRSVEKSAPAYKKYRRINKRKEVCQLLAQGKTYKEIALATGYRPRQVYQIDYRYGKGLLKTTLPNRITEVLKPSMSNATFAMIPKDKMDTARSMVSSCAKSKSRITIADCDTYFGLSVGEAKAFMIDVFQQQKKLGYKVIIDSDRLIFE